MIYDLIIVGFGASGLFAAAHTKARTVLIVEKNATAGRKLLATGGGRCNITNAKLGAHCYTGERTLISRALGELGADELLAHFAPLRFSLEKNAQYFCESGARAVLGALLRAVKFPIKYNCEISEISKDGEIFVLRARSGEILRAKCVIIATGGASFKTLGASDCALKFARNFGLGVREFSPALVGFSVQKSEFWFKNLSGISMNVRLSVPIFGDLNGSRGQMREIEGDLLFAHRGISGPAVLNASLFWKRGKIVINFAPTHDMKSLEKSLNGGKKQLSSAPFLPKRFVLEFLRAHGLEDKIFAKYSDEEREIVAKIFNYEFAPAGNFGFEKAEISTGGVSGCELDENFESVKIPGLYFIGECVDVNGMLGGFNLHFAFASALIAARAINAKF